MDTNINRLTTAAKAVYAQHAAIVQALECLEDKAQPPEARISAARKKLMKGSPAYAAAAGQLNHFVSADSPEVIAAARREYRLENE